MATKTSQNSEEETSWGRIKLQISKTGMYLQLWAAWERLLNSPTKVEFIKVDKTLETRILFPMEILKKYLSFHAICSSCKTKLLLFNNGFKKHLSSGKKRKNIWKWHFIERKPWGWHPMTSVFICKSIITHLYVYTTSQEIVIFKISILAASLIYFHLKTVNKSLLFLLGAFPATQNLRCI